MISCASLKLCQDETEVIDEGGTLRASTVHPNNVIVVWDSANLLTTFGAACVIEGRLAAIFVNDARVAVKPTIAVSVVLDLADFLVLDLGS